MHGKQMRLIKILGEIQRRFHGMNIAYHHTSVAATAFTFTQFLQSEFLRPNSKVLDL